MEELLCQAAADFFPNTKELKNFYMKCLFEETSRAEFLYHAIQAYYKLQKFQKCMNLIT